MTHCKLSIPGGRMPMVPDFESYLFDFYHFTECYFAIENGLLRSSNQIRRGLENVVFPSLFNVKTKNVAEKIQKNIQRVLRNHLNESGYSVQEIEETLKLFSGKSLRQSSITESLNSNKVSVPFWSFYRNMHGFLS